MIPKRYRLGILILAVVAISLALGLQQLLYYRVEHRSRTFQKLVDAKAKAQAFEAELGPPDAIEERQNEVCWKYDDHRDFYATVCFLRETGRMTTWGQVWN